MKVTPKPLKAPTKSESLANALNQSARSSEEPLDEFLLSLAKTHEAENEREERIRSELIISLCRRMRGATNSDLFGVFKDGKWLDHKSFDSLHGTNIFQSLVRGAESNYSSARIRLDVNATGSDVEHISAQRIARGISQVLDQTDWTEAVEAQIFYAAILKLNAFIISRFDRSDDSDYLKNPEFEDIDVEEPGLYICPKCHESDDYTSDTDSCASCGHDGPLTVIDDYKSASMDRVGGFSEMPAGRVRTVIADGLDCRFDDSAQTCASLAGAQWFEYHYLSYDTEIKRLYPHLKPLKEAPQWTLPTQWKMALKKFRNSATGPSGDYEKHLHEMKERWLLPSLYAHRGPEPEDVQIGDFRIAKGERLIEKFPKGLVHGIVGEQVAFIHAERLHDAVTTCVWLADPVSGWGLGAKAGLPIQKKINHLDNINMEGISRALRGSIIYDPKAISGAHLEGANTNIPLRSGFDRNGENIESFFASLNINGLSGDVMAYLQTQHDTIQKVMGVPDAAIGEADPANKTASGQMLLTQRAQGLLIPAKKSQAKAKEDWLLQQLKLIQKFYPAERIRTCFGSRIAHDWSDDEIELFKSANLEKVVTIEYVEGSEVPMSRSEKEAKLLGLIGSGLVPPTPQNLSKLLQQTGIDGIDIMDYESNIKLAKKRWTVVQDTFRIEPELIESQYAMFEQMLVDEEGVRLKGEDGMDVPNPVVLEFLQKPELQVVPEAESHEIHLEWWKSKTRDLISSAIPQSPVLVDIARGMINQHINSATELGMRNTLSQVAEAAPAALAEQGLGDAARDLEFERQQEAADQDSAREMVKEGLREVNGQNQGNEKQG